MYTLYIFFLWLLGLRFVVSMKILGRNGTNRDSSIVGDLFLEKLELSLNEFEVMKFLEESIGSFHEVGDIVLSFLDEETFKSSMIGDWGLLDGRDISPSSSLSSLTGLTSLPDAKDRYFRQTDDQQKLGSYISQKTRIPNYVRTSTVPLASHSHAMKGGDATAFVSNSGDHTHGFDTYNTAFEVSVSGGSNSYVTSTSVSTTGGEIHTHGSSDFTGQVENYSVNHTHGVAFVWDVYTRPNSVKLNSYIRIN